jgi:predicted transcriptional regulator
VNVKAERPLFETADPEAEAAADVRADADVRAGRLISHEAVRRWLNSWGSTKPEPRPRPGD